MPATHLYRHFGEDGVLLYVGVSLSAVQRWRSIARTRIDTALATVERTANT